MEVERPAHPVKQLSNGAVVRTVWLAHRDGLVHDVETLPRGGTSNFGG